MISPSATYPPLADVLRTRMWAEKMRGEKRERQGKDSPVPPSTDRTNRPHVGPSTAKSQATSLTCKEPPVSRQQTGPKAQGKEKKKSKSRRSLLLRLTFLPPSSLGAPHACSFPSGPRILSIETCGFEVKLHDSMPRHARRTTAYVPFHPLKASPGLPSVPRSIDGPPIRSAQNHTDSSASRSHVHM